MTIEFKTYTPAGFFAPPESAVGALTQARALLREEGRWCRAQWYQNPDPDVDPDTPFCNSWAVCAEGAVGMVTIGAVKVDSVPWVKSTYSETRRYKNLTLDDYTVNGKDPLWLFNDAVVNLWKDEVDSAIYEEALVLLRDAGAIVFDEVKAQAYNYNDSAEFCNTRDDVDRWFTAAIRLGDIKERHTRDAVKEAKAQARLALRDQLQAVLATV